MSFVSAPRPRRVHRSRRPVPDRGARTRRPSSEWVRHAVLRGRCHVDLCTRIGEYPPIGTGVRPVYQSDLSHQETTLDLWNKVFAVNATGTYLVTKAFLPDMIAQRWGRIVTMSSVSAHRGGGVFGKVPYSSAKAADLGFTKSLARELEDSGVTINAVTPGAVDTNIRVGSTDEQEKAIAQGIPLGRTATTREVASVITFLSSDDAAYLTGTTIDINGGSHMH